MDGGVGDPVSELSIAKTAPVQMVAGREAVWTIDVGNDGPSTATGVTVTDDLDPDTTFVSASPDVCSATGQEVTCDIDDLDPGDAASIELTVMVDEEVDTGTTIENTASASADTDPDGAGDTAVGPPVRVATDLAIAKDFDPATEGPVTPGAEFGYRVTATNLGGSESADNVTFTESLPAALDFVEATNADTGEPLDCDAAGDTVSCSLAEVLEPNASVTAAVTVRLDPSYRGDGQDVTNNVAVSSDAVDPDADNDTASLTGVPGGVGDPVYDRVLTVAEVPPAPPGGTTTVDVAIESKGLSTADGPINLTITMPEHVEAVDSKLPSECTASGDTVVCGIDTGVAPQTEADATRLPERAFAESAVAEASPATSWTVSITVAVAEDAAASAYLSGGAAELNADPYDSGESNDSISWGLWTTVTGGSPGGLITTGGDLLALVLTGVGAILTGLVITAAVTRRRGVRR
jgi:large repetitive protein